tara:strand:+ start:1349 stop:1594 length:246 start_codon:yes stop_codon:yes gene_type:complete
MAATDAQIQAFFALGGETVTDAQLVKIKNWMVAVRGWTSDSKDGAGNAISRPDSTTLVEMLYADMQGKVLHWQANSQAQTF